MTAIMMDGRALAGDLKRQLKAHAARFRYEHGVLPAVALVLAGRHPATRLSLRQPCRTLVRRNRPAMHHLHLPLRHQRGRVPRCRRPTQRCRNGAWRGRAVPLPSHIQQRWVTEVIAPEKDVDGLGPRNAGKLMLGFPSFVPSTAAVVRMLLSHYQIPVRGQHAVIVDRARSALPWKILTLMIFSPIDVRILVYQRNAGISMTSQNNIMEVTPMEMVRKQTYITLAQDRAVKRLAQRLGTTEAELLRRALDSFSRAKASRKPWTPLPI
jgi:hypothetical protein